MFDIPGVCTEANELGFTEGTIDNNREVTFGTSEPSKDPGKDMLGCNENVADVK
jgi:hypothetical protein